MKRIIFLSILSFVLAPRVMAQLEMTKAQYIDKFRHIAIAEMDRSGIPASIKLAQGILESRFGNSSLATEANNHFGIKCHRGWNGKRYYLKDDDLDENGDLIESCFRVYSDAQTSYIDHTEFLMSRDRYAFIFQFDNTDYKNWAKGLKKAGYATNPQYADILIRVVQENKLQKYDKMTSDVPVVINEEDIIEEPFPIQPNESMVVDFFPRKGNKSETFFVNDIKTVTAWPEETMISIAQENGVSLNRLMKYNDMNGGEEPMAGQYVFLQPKRGKFRGRKKYHTVKNGETMYMISQLYGVKLEKLYKRNRLDYKEARDPVNGSQIYLKGKAEEAPKLQPRGYEPPSISTPVNDPNEPGSAWRPATTTQPNTNANSTDNTNSLPNNPDGIVVPPPVSRPVITDPQTERPQPTEQPTNDTSDLDELDNILFKPNQGSPDKTPPVVDPEIPAPTQPNLHTVQPGDTLYSISRKYNLSVDQLKRKNGLTDNLIKVGQELIIE